MTRVGRAVSTVQARPRAAVAYAMNVQPSVRSLQDNGHRNPSAPTRIAIVLHPTSTLASDEAKVVGVLRDAGLTIVQTFSNHLIVDAQGPSHLIESLFHTTIHDYNQPGHGTRYAPVQPATIPASLAPYVNGILLDNLWAFRHHARWKMADLR